MDPTLHIRLFGDPIIHDGDTPLAGLDTPRLQAFLAYLLLHRDAPQARSHLAFLFWPDSTEAQAMTNLRKQIYHLRRALPQPDRFLQVHYLTVQWVPNSPFDLDVASFETAVARAEEASAAGDSTGLEEALTAAAAAYTGDLLPACYDDWLLEERSRLQQVYATVLERLADALEQRGRYEPAIGYAQQLLRHDRLSEGGYRRLMRLYALAGDRARALRTYHECASLLQAELGVEPSAATQSLYQRLLATPADARPEAAQPRASSRQPAGGGRLSVAPWLDRENEWHRLQASWQAAAGGQPQLAIISGEAGIGKTRLAEEMVAWAGRQGIATAIARCHASEAGLAYAPAVAWLRSPAVRDALLALEPSWLGDLARLLPELQEDPGVPRPEPLAESWQSQRLMAALAQPLVRLRQLLLVLDDVQRCDAKTLEWLAYLFHAESHPGLLLLATLGLEEEPQRGLLLPLLQDLRRDGQLLEIELDRLDEVQSLRLAEAIAGHRLAPDRAAALYRQTEGNPLFVIETVRAGMPALAPEPVGGRPAPDSRDPMGSGADRSLLPAAVHAAIAARLEGLSPEARELAGVASVIGRAFRYDILALASGAREEELVAALDELWRRRIVREMGTDAYDFAHEQLRAVTYAGLSRARRRLLHRQVAEAMETLAGEQEMASIQIGLHWDRAGQPGRSLPHYRRAAATAARLYAHDEAERIYRHLLEDVPAGLVSPAETCELLLELAQVWRLTARWIEAETLCRRALALAESLADNHLRARCRRALADALRLPGSYEEALAQLAAARDGFEAAGDRQSVGAVLGTMGEIHWRQGDNERALAAHERQVQIAAELGDRREMCDGKASLGMVLWSLGRLELAEASCREALEMAREIGHLWAVGRATLTLGNIAAARRDQATALALYSRAQRMAEEIGDRQGWLWAAANVGNLHRLQGDLERGLAHEAQVGAKLQAMGDAWGLSILLSHLAQAHERQGHSEQAEALYRQASALTEVLDANHLRAYMGHLAAFHASQARFREARILNDQVLEQPVTGEDGSREGVNFEARVLGVRLRYELGEVGAAAAVAELEAMLARTADAERQAVLHQVAWQMDPRQEAHRQAAAALYRTLYGQSHQASYLQAYERLGGENLPPLPGVLGTEQQGQAGPRAPHLHVRAVQVSGASPRAPSGASTTALLTRLDALIDGLGRNAP